MTFDTVATRYRSPKFSMMLDRPEYFVKGCVPDYTLQVHKAWLSRLSSIVFGLDIISGDDIVSDTDSDIRIFMHLQ